MTLHDAAMLRFGQWWTRARRAGHAFAELAARHPTVRWPDWSAVCRRIILWGGVLPFVILLTIVLGMTFGGDWLWLTLLLLGGWLANVGRLYLRRLNDGLQPHIAHASALLLMVGKLPEFLGLAGYHLGRLRGRRSALIEYKA